MHSGNRPTESTKFTPRRLPNPDTTRRLASAVAAALCPGDVIALDGPLGAGKTTFARALVEALGGDLADFGSPTFVLAREYPSSRIPLIHCDAYRLADPEEFLAIGADEFFAGPSAVLIEWAERVAEVLPDDRLHLRLEPTGETSRRLTLGVGGPRSAALAAAIVAAVPEA
ncbi:MAG: tRNA (adenosine(37)-N6)-threonylcarbamoyltransferase complex ATPase subunit type 1 TsaE [Planctomycetota bacterium]